jgi:hypothetical protein
VTESAVGALLAGLVGDGAPLCSDLGVLDGQDGALQLADVGALLGRRNTDRQLGSLLGVVAWEEHKLGLVLLQALDVLLESSLGSVAATMVDGDTDGESSTRSGDTGELSLLNIQNQVE